MAVCVATITDRDVMRLSSVTLSAQPCHHKHVEERSVADLTGPGKRLSNCIFHQNHSYTVFFCNDAVLIPVTNRLLHSRLLNLTRFC